MNSNRYRLVYSAILGMFVPVSETSMARGRKSLGKRMRSRYAAAALLTIANCNYALAAPPAVNALPTAGVVTSGAAIINTPINTNAMTVDQSTQNAIINWGSFNIGAKASVDFKMPNSTSQVLNRVAAGSGLSQIYGKLTANGQVYLINPNGILFGSGSQVNVNSLVASSLNISDDLFNKGYLTLKNGNPQFTGTTGYIEVDAGAEITAATGGKVLMFAPNIKNNGLIKTPDGQTLLAAGQKVYLLASEDRNLRGLLVEVDNGGTVDNGFAEFDENNKPINGKVNVGQIIAERGNITLAGIAVNQNGRLKATTSVSANGSIKIQARDTVTFAPGDVVTQYTATVGGNVELGENSLTEVSPELSDKTTVLDTVDVKKSAVDISGTSIHLQKNAWIVAPSGDVKLSAVLNPSAPTVAGFGADAKANTSRIYFESDSGIDVSGVGSGSQAPSRAGETAAQVSVASNVVQAELRGNELRDSPLQRTGILYKANVYVDSRATGIDGNVGTSVADVSGYVASIKHGIGERLAAGGTVKVQSEGDIVMAPNATINVSGGKVDYTSATVNKTRLQASNGQVYDIANASKDLNYVAIQNVSVQEQGYSDGKDAGSVTFSAPAMVLEGKLKGDTVAGTRQRALDKLPKGPTLEIGQNKVLVGANLTSLANTNVLHSDIIFDGISHTTVVPSFNGQLTNEQIQTLRLGTNFTPTSFSNLRYYADGKITVNKGVNIETKPGGNVVLDGGSVDVQGNLTAHSGAIEIAAATKLAYIGRDTSGQFTNNVTNDVEVGANATLNTSGLWVNDKQNAAATDVIALSGGKVSISAAGDNQKKLGGNVSLKTGSVINASGGAWLNASGKLNSGKGGEIELKSGAGYADGEAHKGKLVLDGTLRADSLSTGGSLLVSSGSVTIGSKESSTNGELLLNPAFFRTGGFNSYTVNSYEGLKLQENTTIEPVTLTRILDRGYTAQNTGADIANFSHLSLLPTINAAITRKPTSLSLNATTESFGDLTLGAGSKVNADPGAKLSFTGIHQLTVLGTIAAPAGAVSMILGKNPDLGQPVGYLNNQTLWLGDNSVIDVSGIADSYINNNGYRVGSVKDAGNIVLDAKKGVVVAEKGAKLNLSGTHTLLDVKSGNSYVAKDIASKGGSLSILAREGVLSDASIDAHGGSAAVASGNFTLNLYESGTTTGAEGYPDTPREIILKKSGSALPVDLVRGMAIDAALNGKAFVVTDAINQAGFDNVSLVSPNNIRVSESATLATRGSINIDAPNLLVDKDVRAVLNASFVAVGNTPQQFQAKNIDTSTAGTGTLDVLADYIELSGNQNLSGVANANFNSKGDIQLKGVLSTNKNIFTPTGSLTTAGNINFTAGRIYPSTLSNYTLKSTGETSAIAFKKAISADAGVPFSVLGTLNVEAANIEQDGVLRAPFGEINLKAKDTLSLGSESLTSVSAEGKTLPFGNTQNGNTWTFDEDDRSLIVANITDKNINLSGKSVNIVNGSKVDVSGGGDLAAYEFTTGTGGSDDVLTANGIFAILPDLKAGYMAGNSESYSNSTFKVGDSIYLSGGNGLAAGYYVLLPAHYALLPNGYSVKTVAGTQDFNAQQNISNRDGSMLMSGYRTQFGGITADSRSSGFLVASGNVARTQSEYTNTLAGKFFNNPEAATSGLRLPTDAGRVAISAITNLVLDGALVTNHASTARGAEVSISSDKIAISGNSTQEAGFLTLSSDKLNAIGAESLTIGAKTSGTAKGTLLDVTASTVKLIGGANLTGQQIMLAATDSVTMAAGTSIVAKGAATNNSGALIVGNADVAASGDGALLRVSTGEQPDLVRNSVTQTKGALDVQAGAKVSGTAVIADATKANSVKGDVTLAKDGAIRLGSPKISFGTPAAPVSGLLLDNSKLEALGSPSNIQLKSYSSIDFYGTTSVGNANLKSLTLESAGLVGFNSADSTVTLTADTIKLTNPDNAKFEPVGTLGSGTLAINSTKEISLGDGTFNVAGFKTAQLNADQVIGTGKGGLNVTGDITIDAGRITATGLSDETIKATGNLQTLQHSVTGLAKAPLGGKLTLEADTIKHGGKIDLPSGIVTIKAIGKAGGDSLTLQAGSQINAQGSAQLLGTVTALADGGTVNLQTENGNVFVDKGAIIDVSATGGAAAGAVVINTVGIANLAGTLNGLAAVGNGVGLPKQGSFELTASRLDNFGALNTELERGNFNQSRNIHLAQGDINLADTDNVTAHNVTLTTDDGNITVASTIDASGDKGGIVKLNAGQQKNHGNGNIKLASTAKINANAKFDAKESAGSKGDGGKVLLNTTTDSDITPANGSTITALAGSEINVSGKGLGSDGKVTLRAPRLGMASATDAGNGISVTQFAATVKGANANIVAEGIKVYKTAGDKTIDSAFISTLKAGNRDFLANSGTIASNLGLAGDKRFVVASGDEVRSTGNIKVAADINFNETDPSLPNAGSGTLTLRAKGDVNVNANISAGFTTAKTTGTLTSGGAWTYRIAAGADLNSADVLATNSTGTGNFTLAADKLIRTGTGDIDIATGGDFKLGSIASAIYTAGEKDNTDYSALGRFVTPASVGGVSPVFALNGGDITLTSKGNITGVAYSSANVYQLPTNWLNRSGPFGINGFSNKNTSWWASYSNFKENLGALAGGDVTIKSGGDITELSAVVATNGRVFGASASTSTLVVNGGGDLTVQAGGNIRGGLYMVDKGVANIASDGAILADANNINTAFALGDGTINVATKGQLNLQPIFNPTATSPSKANYNSLGASGQAYFSTYSADSAVNLTSLASGVAVKYNGRDYDSMPNSFEESLFNLLPPNLTVAALGGDITIADNLAMLPAANGNLQLAASGSIKFDEKGSLNMSDADPALLPTALAPAKNTNTLNGLLSIDKASTDHAAIPLHADDSQPVVLYAGKDITGTNDTASLVLPKKATIFAGHDIVDFSIFGQNLKASDVTTISAGNDFGFLPTIQDNRFSSNFKRIDWGGEGYLDIVAGRNVDLGNSYGVVSSGNLRNPYLPQLGASISVLAGAANADDAELIAKYIDPLVSKAYASDLTQFVNTVIGKSNLTDAEAWNNFQALDASLKHQFVQSVFFNELKQAGIEHNDPKSAGFGSYKRGFDAIATYFPNNNYDGNLDIAFSQIKTLRGGDINLMLPGGSALIGLPKIPPSLISAKDDVTTSYDDTASLLGLVTVGGGKINVFAKNNIDVAVSREFTLQGGEIVNWATLGNIDAGKGKKTSTSAPPPVIRTDDKGNTIVDVAGSVSGSGIGTIQTLPNTPVSDVYLIAPAGTVDAGDAGIRVSGNVLIAATRVLGADNIKVGGTSSGVPAVSTVNISFTAPTSADSVGASKQGDQLGSADKLGDNSKMAKLLSLINVEVISLGDESTSTSKNCADEKTKVGNNKKDCQP